MTPISPLSGVQAPLQPSALNSVKGPDASAPAFKDFLLDSIKEVNGMQTQANRAVETLATGGEINPAEVLTAVQKADLAFRTMLQIRNKLVQSYDEIKNIRV
ncbi:MAG: flagellar hook-basal body complex protein FliE [Pirellulales bacterium]